jgi:hypothetical protein
MTRSGRTSSATRPKNSNKDVKRMSKNMVVTERYFDTDRKENLEEGDKITVSDERAELLIAAGVAKEKGGKPGPDETKPLKPDETK